MTAISEQVLADFISAWRAGERPDVEVFLARVPEAERAELAEDIATYVTLEPSRPLSPEARAAIRAEAPFVAAMQRLTATEGLLGAEVRTLRARRGLDVRALAARVVDAFGLRPADRDRAVTYVERLESGELEPAGVSRRLLDVLADALDTSREQLAAAAMHGRGPAVAGGALYRLSGEGDFEEDDLAVLSEAALAPAEAYFEQRDVLDELFTGGPDA